MSKKAAVWCVAFHLLVGGIGAAPLLDKGDAAFRQRSSRDRAFEALALYREHFRQNPDDPESGWRVAMACQFVGHRLVENDDEKMALFKEGALAGERSLAHTRTPCAPCHFWTAINRALYGNAVGPLRMLSSLKAIRQNLKSAAEIAPDYAGGGPYRILGLIEQKLPALLGGSNRQARHYLEQAIEAAPDEPLNYLFLARLIEENDPTGATKIIRRGLLAPSPSPERIESVEALQELRALKGRLALVATR